MKRTQRERTRGAAGDRPPRLLLLVVALALAVPHAADAFPSTKTVSGGNVLGVSHAEMTETAIREFLLEGPILGLPTRITRSMENAIDDIVAGNVKTDDFDAAKSEAHLDGENFVGRQARIAALRAQIVTSLSQGNITARDDLGRAPRTLQGLYSHRNWIEPNNNQAVVHPTLGTGGSIANVSPLANTTCQSCVTPPVSCPDYTNTLVTGSLTSGYYQNQGRDRPRNKCAYGGVLDGLAFGLKASKKFLRELLLPLPVGQRAALFGLGPTFVVVMDTTATMASAIGTLKANIINLVSARIGAEDELSLCVLVPFTDPRARYSLWLSCSGDVGC